MLWLDRMRTRKRKPIAPSTLADWERILKNWINPLSEKYPFPK